MDVSVETFVPALTIRRAANGALVLGCALVGLGNFLVHLVFFPTA
jgi:hypothetical protein